MRLTRYLLVVGRLPALPSARRQPPKVPVQKLHIDQRGKPFFSMRLCRAEVWSRCAPRCSPMAAGTMTAIGRWWNSSSARRWRHASIVQTNEPGFRKGDRVIILRYDKTHLARPG